MMYELLGRPGNCNKVVCEISDDAHPSFNVSEDGWCWILRGRSHELLSAISRDIDRGVAGLPEISSGAVEAIVRDVWEQWRGPGVEYTVLRNNGEVLGFYADYDAARAALGDPDENYIDVRRIEDREP